MFGNVRLAFGTILENLVKSSENGRKSSENHQKRRHQYVYIIKEHYYMEESVLLGTKPLVDSMRHFIRDPSGVFSVCHI